MQYESKTAIESFSYGMSIGAKHIFYNAIFYARAWVEIRMREHVRPALWRTDEIITPMMDQITWNKILSPRVPLYIT